MNRKRAFDDTQAEPAEIPPPIPAFSWMGSLSPLLLAPMLLLVLIALFAPANVLDQWPVAKAFTDWMQVKLPFINRHADSTSYPQLALLVNCLTVALFPVLSLVWLVQSFVNYPKLLARNRATKRLDVKTHLFIIVISLPFTAVMLYVMVGVAGDPSWAKGFTTHNRVGLAMLGAGMLWGMSMLLGGWPLLIRTFIDLHMRKVV